VRSTSSRLSTGAHQRFLLSDCSTPPCPCEVFVPLVLMSIVFPRIRGTPRLVPGTKDSSTLAFAESSPKSFRGIKPQSMVCCYLSDIYRVFPLGLPRRTEHDRRHLTRVAISAVRPNGALADGPQPTAVHSVFNHAAHQRSARPCDAPDGEPKSDASRRNWPPSQAGVPRLRRYLGCRSVGAGNWMTPSADHVATERDWLGTCRPWAKAT
jgi:hypothetical protein